MLGGIGMDLGDVLTVLRVKALLKETIVRIVLLVKARFQEDYARIVLRAKAL
jgi:hypothetical protein